MGDRGAGVPRRRIAHALSDTALRRLAGVLCIATSGLLFARSI